MVAVAAAVWLLLAILGIAREMKSGARTRWAPALFGFLVVTGGIAFFLPLLLAEGAFALPGTFEWPAGLVEGVAANPGGGYVVPLRPVGRVQLYDSGWKFLRGWNVQAHGGTFWVKPEADGTIEVYTARRNHRYVYSQAGDLLSSGIYPGIYRGNDGGFVKVPTDPLVWMFSSPFVAWCMAMTGMLGLVWMSRWRSPQRRS